MKYQSEHGFTHPVLSPESDHYPNGSFTTQFHKPEPADGAIRFGLDFQIQEPVLEQLVSDGKALCTAMLYCRATLHQQTLRAATGHTQIGEAISADLLRDAIELHPLIVATETLVLDTSTADPFYQGLAIEVHEGEPLAADRGWHFSLDVASLPLGSIFQFVPDPALTGPMRIEANPGETYIAIRVNADQLQKMNIVRQQRLTIPSVFTAALVDAIPAIRRLGEDYEAISPGWVDTIKKQAAKHDIALDDGDISPFEIAQTLLGDPFQDLVNFQIARGAEEPE